MKKIAIFVSGEGVCTRRVVTLFKDGDRINVELVVTDRENSGVISDPDLEGTEVVYLPREDWREDSGKLSGLLADRGVGFIALDDFRGIVPEEVLNEYSGRIIILTSPEDAPLEIVTALEKSDVVAEPSASGGEPMEKSVDEEWAESLKIDYDGPKLRTTPPPVPGSHDRMRRQNEVRQNMGPVFGSAQYYGTPQENVDAEPMPSTYMIWSVLSTVFCCFIPGIVAIVFSSQVSSRYYSGDIEGSKRASRRAEIWIIVSFILGVLSSTLYIPIMLLSV